MGKVSWGEFLWQRLSCGEGGREETAEEEEEEAGGERAGRHGQGRAEAGGGRVKDGDQEGVRPSS